MDLESLFSFVPYAIYTKAFQWCMFALCMFIGFDYLGSRNNQNLLKMHSSWPTFILAVLVILYMGLRPDGAQFGDSYFYRHTYYNFESDSTFSLNTEWLFGWIQQICKTFRLNHRMFFLVVEIGYIGFLYAACRKLLWENTWMAFLFCISAFSFFSFGVNGIRNGLALHLLLLAFSLLATEKNWIIPIVTVLCIAALGIHRTSILPILGALGAYYIIKDPKTAIYIWVGSVFASIVAGGTFVALLGDYLGAQDVRASSYTAQIDMSEFSHSVHTHNTAPQLFAALAHIVVRRPRLITTEHNTTNRRRDKWYLKWGDCWMYRQYEKIICISEQARDNLAKYIGEDSKIITIFNGIELSRLSKALPLRTFGRDKRIVTMVSAFRAQKDHRTLICAFSMLPDNYILQLVGDGELRSETEAYVQSLSCADRIFFLGNRGDVPELLKGSDVVVLSSHYEGLSLSSLEGMASGCPFIASDVDGLHEIVDGYGILFPHEDADALAKAIMSVCEDSEYAADIAEKCKKRAQQFDISYMVQQYNRVYQTYN